MTRTTLGCLLKGHVYADEWVLRPAWVGADISIDAVHFDRRCSRCGALDSVWSSVRGEPQPEPLHLSEWLTRNRSRVERPAGVVHLPEGGTF